jgi:hypothetical protein
VPQGAKASTSSDRSLKWNLLPYTSFLAIGSVCLAGLPR